MIRNTVLNTVSFFYPLGNTPAVCLTQDLPPGKDADLLLLGCGDARNVLFTCFVDPDRKLDVTCCDIEPAIIARNVLLYTLLVDDNGGVRSRQIWNVYYHWKVDDESLDLLQRQADKLLSLSGTATAWRASCYGETLRFCDERSINKIRGFWKGCSTQGPATHLSPNQELLQSNIARAKSIRRAMAAKKHSLAGVRSAAPTALSAIEDLSIVTTKWWEDGITTSSTEYDLLPNRLNPAFLATTDQRLTLHYGLEPLLGFPLATAYIPLLNDSCLYAPNEGSSSSEYLSACAYQHFCAWAQSFRKSVTRGTTIWFCVADALAFSLTLRAASDTNVLTANIPCNNWTCEALLLDTEYTSSIHHAPLRFDVIDTSNLVDHLGPLNILPSCATLLKHKIWSTLYTENLVQHDSDERERIVSLMGVKIQTIALLLGLSPCETWTNATHSPEDESMLSIPSDKGSRNKIDRSSQTRSRLRWKRTYPLSQGEICSPVHIGTQQMARVLVKLYNHMFEHENLSAMFAALKGDTLSKHANPCYNRASFAMILASMQQTIVADWSSCIDEVMSQITSDFLHSPCGLNFAQELFLYMHMFGSDTTRLLSIDLIATKNARMATFFSAWPDVPPYVCVTLRVPRKELQVVLSKTGITGGTPSLRCDIEGGGSNTRPWSNTFASVIVTFGHAHLSQHHGAPALRIDEDESNWWGPSDMYVSVFVPTWTLLQPDDTTPKVRCGLVLTPQSCYVFSRYLGSNLSIYSADMTSEEVVVSRYMPTMTCTPTLTLQKTPAQPAAQQSLNVHLSSKDTTIERLVHHISYASRAEASQLCDRSTTVQVRFGDAWKAFVKVGREPEFQVNFPIPVDRVRHKVRVARTSLYVEIEAPPWNPLLETSSSLLFPTIQPQKSAQGPSDPVSWTATQVNLDISPIINISDKQRLQWLVTHAYMMFSTKERQIRELSMAGRPKKVPSLRAEIKDGLFSMLMGFTGLQCQQTSIFGLEKEVGGVNILFWVSSIRLDLVNRTVVLDAAAIPLTKSMIDDSRVRSFYQSITNQRVMQIKVSNDELYSWKSSLPALAERCRRWEHASKCEYASTGEAPIRKGLEDGCSPLCSCGVGKFPPSYLRDFRNNNLRYVLERYATRVAISPFFPLPYVEDCFLMGLSLAELQPPNSPAETRCGHCGSNRRKNADVTNTKLLICARCRKTNYCSVECQRADWKNHKGSCSRSDKQEQTSDTIIA